MLIKKKIFILNNSLDFFKLKLKNVSKDSLYCVPQFPKSKYFNWLNIITPLINKLEQEYKIKKDDVVLIDSIENNSNFNFQSKEIIDILINIVNEKKIFQLVSENVIESSRSFLGFLNEDNLINKNKIIGLARYIKSDYVLYLIILNKKFEKEIKMQLIRTISGEIVWTGKKIF